MKRMLQYTQENLGRYSGNSAFRPKTSILKGVFFMRLIRAKDYQDVSRKAANIIAAQIYLKPDCVLGLATGSSPVGTYKELIAKFESGDLDFSQVSYYVCGPF